MAGCCYGKPYDGLLAVTYPACSLLAPAGIPRHPVPLYEAGLNLVLFAVLLVILRRRKTPMPGWLTGLYLVSYSIIRTAMELLRDDRQGMVGTFTISQVISVLLLAAGITLLALAPRWAAKNTSDIADDTT